MALIDPSPFYNIKEKQLCCLYFLSFSFSFSSFLSGDQLLKERFFSFFFFFLRDNSF